MVATHTMKINGVVYRAGEEIPSPDEKPVIVDERVDEKPIIVNERVDEKKYSKSDIKTMKAADLRVLAEENGIERPDEYTGSELKEMLIERFGL